MFDADKAIQEILKVQQNMEMQQFYIFRSQKLCSCSNSHSALGKFILMKDGKTKANFQCIKQHFA